MPSPSCIQSSARNVVTGLLDSNQPSPVSSGVGAQATQTLLGRSAQMAYHYTIRPYSTYLLPDKLLRHQLAAVEHDLLIIREAGSAKPSIDEADFSISARLDIDMAGNHVQH